MPRRFPRLSLLLALPAFLSAGDVVSLDSPFLPEKGVSTVAAPADNSEFEYVGALTAGNDTMIGILNKNTQKSFWVGVGKTVEGVEIVSRNRDNGEIVARYGGSLHTLKIRPPSLSKTQAVAYTPPAPAATLVRPGPQPNQTMARPAKPTPALTPQQQANAEQEREARMLVSDLLEIGAQQRKAYEEAQKRKSSPPAPAAK